MHFYRVAVIIITIIVIASAVVYLFVIWRSLPRANGFT